MPRRRTLTRTILEYYEARPTEDIPAEDAARALGVNGKVLASILSRLRREGSVVRVSRGVYRVPSSSRALPDLRHIGKDLRATVMRTFGHHVVDRKNLHLPEDPTLEDFRRFYVRLVRYIGQGAAEELIQKVASAVVGREDAVLLTKRMGEAN